MDLCTLLFLAIGDLGKMHGAFQHIAGNRQHVINLFSNKILLWTNVLYWDKITIYL